VRRGILPAAKRTRAREQKVGVCEHCKRRFGYYLIHNGFNESAYAYCEACGTTALLDKWKVPKGIEVNWDNAITPGIEHHLAKCPCGGAFRAGASPRCPHCREPLSATQASEYIERQPAVFKGLWRWKLLWAYTQGRLRNRTYLSPVRWQWQRTWTDLYCIIIDNRVVRDVWSSAR
jgi:hypothetical protein